MKNWIKISIIVILALAVAVGVAAGWFYYSVNKKTQFETPIEFKVEKGGGVKSVALKAKSLGVISSPFLFESYVYIMGDENKLKAGDYIYSGQLSLADIVGQLMKGDKKSGTKKITLIEGWNIKDIDKYLAENGLVAPGEYAKAVNDTDFVASIKSSYDFFGDLPPGASLEGYLFPDTYSIFSDASVKDIVHKQLYNFNEKFRQDWRQAAYAQGKSLNQIVVLASIIEKEVRKPEDMKMVSGIFWNRLKIGQPLQSCATLAYILGVNKSQYSIEDTKVVSPYNTYQYKGLPPGPISNPGVKAIEAAIFPTQSDYQYFLTADGTGETIYSRTYEEHLRNKAKYLK